MSRSRLVHRGDQVFKVVAPELWNQLLLHITNMKLVYNIFATSLSQSNQLMSPLRCMMGCFLILQEFRRISFSGYSLNVEQDNFYYLSLSRLHPQRIQAAKRLSESAAEQHPGPCSARTPREAAMPETAAEVQPDTIYDLTKVTFILHFQKAPGRSCFTNRIISCDKTTFTRISVRLQSDDRKSTSLLVEVSAEAAADSSEAAEAEASVSVTGDRGQPLQLQSECGADSHSPPKTASSISLAESVQSASHSESITHRPLQHPVARTCTVEENPL